MSRRLQIVKVKCIRISIIIVGHHRIRINKHSVVGGEVMGIWPHLNIVCCHKCRRRSIDA